MNDFTKEELESMLNWGDVYSEFGQSWTYKIMKPLMDKIQSKIDNYCEHRNLTQDSAMVDCCLDCNWSGFK